MLIFSFLVRDDHDVTHAWRRGRLRFIPLLALEQRRSPRRQLMTSEAIRLLWKLVRKNFDLVNLRRLIKQITGLSFLH